jgi:hypothetical protein
MSGTATLFSAIAYFVPLLPTVSIGPLLFGFKGNDD